MGFLLPRHSSDHTQHPYASLSPSAEVDVFLPLPSPSSTHRPSSSLSSSHTLSAPSSPFYTAFPPSSPTLRPSSPFQTFLTTHAPPPPTTKRGRTRWFYAAVLLALLSGLVYSAGQESVEVSVEKVKQGSGNVNEWGGGAWEAAVGWSREREGEEGQDEEEVLEKEVGLDKPLPKEELLVEVEKESPVVEPPRKHKAPPSPACVHFKPALSTPIEEIIDTSGPTIPISTFPRPRRPPPDSTTKYIGFLPHSGFHNQRSALQNAFLLGAYLNRTVLVPPVWIGWPTSTLFYDELQQAWTDMVVMNPSSFGLPPHSFSDPLYLPAHYESAIPSAHFNDSLPPPPKTDKAQHWRDLGWEVRPDGYPITNLTAADCKSYSAECRHTYKDTFLAWDFLVELDKVKEVVGVIDRWDIRERALEGLLNVTKDDIAVFRDEAPYDLQFTTVLKPTASLTTPNTINNHWRRLLSLHRVAALPHKVLLVGSLFGSGRVRASLPGFAPDEAEAFFSRSMAFRNPWLMRPAQAIQGRMGGRTGYVGVHARIGDGVFLRKAGVNMEIAWRMLVGRLGVSSEVEERVWEVVRPTNASEAFGRGLAKHARRGLAAAPFSEWAALDGEEEEERSFMRRGIEERHPVEVVPALESLVCRGERHTDPSLSAFNSPVYLATDSRSPPTDPHLAIFFRAFPCTFILSDFDRPSELNGGIVVDSVGGMMKLVNKEDDVPLGRLFLPFLEAMIAAMGATTVGTPGSTFSQFAGGHLHDAYAMDEVV